MKKQSEKIFSIEKTIDDLKANNLINVQDKVLFCYDSPSSGAFIWGGAIGAAVSMASSKVSYYIIAINESELKLFVIDNNDGSYSGLMKTIKKQEIAKIKNQLLVSLSLAIKTKDKFTYKLTFPYKYKGFDQKPKVMPTLKYLRKDYLL